MDVEVLVVHWVQFGVPETRNGAVVVARDKAEKCDEPIKDHVELLVWADDQM